MTYWGFPYSLSSEKHCNATLVRDDVMAFDVSCSQGACRNSEAFFLTPLETQWRLQWLHRSRGWLHVNFTADISLLAVVDEIGRPSGDRTFHVRLFLYGVRQVLCERFPFLLLPCMILELL